MSRALRLVTVAVALVWAGLAIAQFPPSPSPTPTTPSVTPSSPTPIPAPTPAPAAPIPGATAADATQTTIPAGRSMWRSQDGSVADLTIDPVAGTLTGTFTPGFPCGLTTPLTTAARPLVGTVTGNAVAWTLSLSNCPSVGAWIGHFQTAGAEQQLAMLWTLAVPESPPGVGSILAGSALFVRQATP